MGLMGRNAPPHAHTHKLHPGRQQWDRREIELGTHSCISVLDLTPCPLWIPIVFEQGDLCQ